MNEQSENKLSKYLSPIGAWALSLGCAVGWGAFMMPGTTFLPIAGPLGTMIGMLIGAAVMLIIGISYNYLMKRHPDAGGAYTFAKRIFGFDHGFIAAWFLLLVYIAIIWANATALPLVFRFLAGDIFQFGFSYEIAGFQVYFGELLLAIGAIIICGLVCAFRKKIAGRLQIVLTAILVIGVLFCTGAAIANHGGSLTDIAPAFSPDNSVAPSILAIVVLAPWAYVGFESISHSSEEFKFSNKKISGIFIAALVTAALLYIFLSQIAASYVPEGSGDWYSYVNNLESYDGLANAPVFNAVGEYLGTPGLVIIGITVIGAILTGLIGNFIAASRLVFSMSQDRIIPERLGKVSRRGVPANAVIFIVLLSAPIPLLGRTAISWIVDITTIGAAIAYIYVSAAAVKQAGAENNKKIKIVSIIGLVISLFFCLYFLVPNVWSVSGLSTESYLILLIWSIAGFVIFRFLMKKDDKNRFGTSTVTWVVLLLLILFISTIWVREETHIAMNNLVGELSAYNDEELSEHGVILTETERDDTIKYLENQRDKVSDTLLNSGVMQMAVIVVSLAIMLSVYNIIKKREQKALVEKTLAEQSSRAKSNFFSSMSHDIRTPMNAIVGYTELAKKEQNVPDNVMKYLDKIEAANTHLLALINDVLEMSRIESGKVELNLAPMDMVRFFDDLQDMYATRMADKNLEYTVDTSSITDKAVMCDGNRLGRVMLNLVSNAYKYTQSGGKVNVTARQTGADSDRVRFEISVKDTGMGMSPEFAANVFSAYEREKTAEGIQGTGLGMAITKDFVELMNGTIEVESEQGVGSVFTVRVEFERADEALLAKENKTGESNTSFDGLRVLLVDDNEINTEIAKLILENAGFEVTTASDGQEAVEKVAASQPGDFDIMLTDIQMPKMNGYEATKAIRSLENGALANIPIIAMSANAFAEDVQASMDAGMNGHIAKPIEIDKMMATLAEVLGK